jgi:NDP-sugar pyrophosphorylase family protein
MKAMILAAGEGTRLRPLTANHPTPMLEVGGVPLIEQNILWLKRYSVTEIAINLHYKPWAIVHHLGHGRRWGLHLHYSFEEQLWGTAGAVKQLAWYPNERFVLLYGNVYTDLDLASLLAAHQRGGGALTAAIVSIDNPTAHHIIELDAQARIRRLTAQPGHDQAFSRLAIAGVFIVEPTLLSGWPANQFLDLERDILPQMLADGQPVTGYPIRKTLIQVNTPESYQRAQQLAAQHKANLAQAESAPQIVAPTVQNVFQRFVFAYPD